MRTTVELPDDLFRQVKARAALQGRSLKELIAEGLRLLLQTPKDAQAPARGRRTRFPIIQPKDPARRLTPEMVAAAEEQLLTEEAAAHGRLAGH
jgi:Arc/MetJ-type ribon-helix-helix transcriptional regulator